MYKGWKPIRCSSCNGLGVVAVYSAYDFEGPGECRECGGAGQIWISPKGHLAQYPGGRWRGSLPKAERVNSPTP